ncbi:MAG TPA: branched-chain amino acid transaminase [Candidatus Altiarchaeales archaeon]|nr:branched-chain amino acid transaminase [Candidatus Altiarchaeales archaeon]
MPIAKCEKIWMNGALVNWDEAKIHVLTHALHYGSGVFEGIRCYHTKKGPAVFRLKDHMIRLAESGKAYYMNLPYTVDELCKATKDTIRANNLDSCYIRPIAYRGYGEMGLNPLKSVIDVSIACWSWGTYLGEQGLKNGITTIISKYRRIPNESLPLHAKACGQYLNSILAKIEALEAKVDEAIMLDQTGLVAEGPGENIFMVKDGQLLTPALGGILAGITRNSILTIAKEEGIPSKEAEIDTETLLSADELFFTGTAAEVTPIRKVDSTEIGKPGQITRKLQDRFFKIVRGEDKKHEDWLDYVR